MSDKAKREIFVAEGRIKSNGIFEPIAGFADRTEAYHAANKWLSGRIAAAARVVRYVPEKP